jgi:hypothetical protein
MASEAGLEMPGALEWLLDRQLPDGGWNCRREATHSSFGSTLSVLESLAAFEPMPAAEAGREFLLVHRLFRSHRTGDVVRASFTRFSFPCYWHYDVLRALDYWRAFEWDDRLSDGIELLVSKRRDGTWPLQNTHRGRTWITMETPGKPSRWNTLRALRVLQSLNR